MMTGPLSIGRPPADLPVLSARQFRTGFVVGLLPRLDRKRHERDERPPGPEQVEIEDRYSENQDCLVEDDQKRGRKNQRPEQEKGDNKLATEKTGSSKPCATRSRRERESRAAGGTGDARQPLTSAPGLGCVKTFRSGPKLLPTGWRAFSSALIGFFCDRGVWRLPEVILSDLETPSSPQLKPGSPPGAASRRRCSSRA